MKEEYNEKENTPQTPKRRTTLETISCILSYVFPPFIVPSVVLLWLFLCTYLNIMPLQYKLFAISVVVSFTILMPLIFIYIYQKINHWKFSELGNRKKRHIPYILSIMGYGTCLLTMYNLHFPRYMSGIVIASLICMILCAIINLKWKISTHTAASGLMIGSLLSYSLIFLFNPVWWLCVLILQSGLIGTARIIVKQHTLCEISAGFIIGIFCGIIGILFI